MRRRRRWRRSLPGLSGRRCPSSRASWWSCEAMRRCVCLGLHRQALRATVELQHRFRGSTPGEPASPLGVGMGLDAGEAVPTEGGYRGGALNLAARLCALALPGEVLASETVVHLARRVEGIRFAAPRLVTEGVVAAGAGGAGDLRAAAPSTSRRSGAAGRQEPTAGDRARRHQRVCRHRFGGAVYGGSGRRRNGSLGRAELTGGDQSQHAPGGRRHADWKRPRRGCGRRPGGVGGKHRRFYRHPRRCHYLSHTPDRRPRRPLEPDHRRWLDPSV